MVIRVVKIAFFVFFVGSANNLHKRQKIDTWINLGKKNRFIQKYLPGFAKGSIAILRDLC